MIKSLEELKVLCGGLTGNQMIGLLDPRGFALTAISGDILNCYPFKSEEGNIKFEVEVR